MGNEQIYVTSSNVPMYPNQCQRFRMSLIGRSHNACLPANAAYNHGGDHELSHNLETWHSFDHCCNLSIKSYIVKGQRQYSRASSPKVTPCLESGFATAPDVGATTNSNLVISPAEDRESVCWSWSGKNWITVSPM